MADKPAEGQVQAPQPWGLLSNGHYLQEGGIPLVRKKVMIIGFAPSSMGDARGYFGDPSFEFWGLNQLYLQFPLLVQHATRWFQIHPRREYDMAVRDHKHHDWLAQQTTFPIYMQHKEPDIPLSIPYPKDEILDYFGRYFTNSISWEIALAIYETVKAREATGDPKAGFTDIYIFGVDMATNSEYAEQRPSCEFFMGWARGLGMNVYIPPQSDMLKTAWLYPFEDDSLMRQKVDGRRKELRQRVELLANQEQQSHDGRLSILGALENMNYIEQTWLHNRKLLTFTEGQGYDQVMEPPETPLGFPPTGNEQPEEEPTELYPAIEKQGEDKKE